MSNMDFYRRWMKEAALWRWHLKKFNDPRHYKLMMGAYAMALYFKWEA